jgi:hypothetical protein
MIYNRENGLLPVKRILTMSPYKNLHRYICELIADKATYDKDIQGLSLSVDDLSYEDQGELAALFLEYNERDTTDCFNNPNQTSIDDDITIALLKLLKKDSLNNRQELACMIRENTINRFKPQMQDFIDHVLTWGQVA